VTRARIETAQSARDDLADILEWYTSQGVPAADLRLVTEIRDRVRQLSRLPDSGKVVPEFSTPASWWTGGTASIPDRPTLQELGCCS